MKFKNRKNRKLNYDYSKPGYYFITIVTKNRIPWFGRIENNKIYLNQNGEIAKQCWEDIPKHFSNTRLDEFIIMPEHVHGIIELQNKYKNIKSYRRLGWKDNKVHIHESRMERLPYNKNFERIPVLIGAYKSAVTKNMNAIQDKKFHWQKSYHDQIIWKEKYLAKFQRYIRNNPKMAGGDSHSVG